MLPREFLKIVEINCRSSLTETISWENGWDEKGGRNQRQYWPNMVSGLIPETWPLSRGIQGKKIRSSTRGGVVQPPFCKNQGRRISILWTNGQETSSCSPIFGVYLICSFSKTRSPKRTTAYHSPVLPPILSSRYKPKKRLKKRTKKKQFLSSVILFSSLFFLSAFCLLFVFFPYFFLLVRRWKGKTQKNQTEKKKIHCSSFLVFFVSVPFFFFLVFTFVGILSDIDLLFTCGRNVSAETAATHHPRGLRIKDGLVYVSQGEGSP